MFETRFNNFYITIDMIEGKSVDLSLSLHSDNIDDLLSLQEIFNNDNPKEFFKYISDNLR